MPRPWAERDRVLLARAGGEPSIARYTSLPEWDEPDASEWIGMTVAAARGGEALCLAIEGLSGPSALGGISLIVEPDSPRKASLAYWLLPEARGRVWPLPRSGRSV